MRRTAPAAPAVIAAPTTTERFAYANNAAFLAEVGSYATGKRYAGITQTGSVSLDQSTLYNGNPTAKFRVYTGMDPEDPMFRISNPSGGGDQRLLITWPLRFEPGWRNQIGNGYGGGFSLKTYQLGFSGVNGRILGAFPNGNNIVTGDANVQNETVTRTNENTWVNVTARNLIAGADNVYNDGLWYRYAIYFERLSNHSYRAACYFGRDGTVIPCQGVFNMRDEKVTTVNGIFDMDLGFYFNPLEVGGPGPGVDQWFNIGSWDVWRNAAVPAYTDLGLVAHPITGGQFLAVPDFTGVDFSASFDSSTFNLVAGGSPDTRTLTVTRGAAVSTTSILVKNGGGSLLTPPEGFNLPANVSAVFGATTLASGVNSTTLQLTAAAGATPGTYTAYLNLTLTKQAVGAATVSLPITIVVS
jgi:hypothetical protein